MTEAHWWIWYAEFSHTAVTLAANLLLQTTLIVATGLVSARLLRRRGAAVRSVVLRMTLCAALLCPVASWSLSIGGISGIGISLPPAPHAEPKTERPSGSHSRHASSRFVSDSFFHRRIDVPEPMVREADQARLVSNSALSIRSDRRGSSLQAMGEANAGPHGAAPTETSAIGNSVVMSTPGKVDALSMVYCGLTTIWFVTAIALMARVGIAYLVMCTSRRQTWPVDPQLRTECESLARKLGVPMPRLLVSDRITNPCLIGWWRPTILLPSNPDMITRDVVVHEMAHWARRDCQWNLVAAIAASVVFFQPLLWVLRRRLAHVAEEVCDDYVIVYGGDRRSYARQLVGIAEALQSAWATRTVGVGAMTFRSSPAHRVRRILESLEGPTIRIGGRSLTVIAGLAICGTLAVGMIGANGSEETREFAGSLEAASTSPAKQTGEESESQKKPLGETSSDSRPTKRGDPQILAPLEVEADGRLCSVALKSRDGINEKPYALIGVKALVPYERQVAAYKSALAEATGYSSTRDVPRYLFFLAERAEVPADPEAPLEWKLISNSAYAMKPTARYAETVTEIADNANVIPGVLTMPIPPTKSTRSIESLCLHSKVPRRLERPETQPGERHYETEDVGDHRGDGPTGAKTKMVRFFDFNAKSGQSYRYRISVVLEDPNRPRDPKAAPDTSMLGDPVVQRLKGIETADEKLSKKTGKPRRTFYRQTAWSEPSNIVTVPQAPEGDSPIGSSHPQVKESVRESKESVLTEWEKQYTHQRAILRWARELGEDFNAAVRPLEPIETEVDFPTPPRQQLQIVFRERYANYVDHLLPVMAKLIGSRWAPQSNTTERKDILGGRSPGHLDPQQESEVLHWSPVDQKRLMENHFDWSSQPGGAPSTLQVLYAQEDLWVLEAILRIIRKANGDDHSNKGAVVKAIQCIRIGRDTVAHDRGVDQHDPADRRYVNGKGEPLSGDQLRTAMRSAAGDPSVTVAKRLPVSMKLTMDQHRLNRLLVACGDSVLPLEVRRVRLDGASLSDRLGEALNKESAHKASKEDNQEKGSQTEAPHSADVTVELDGLIYIYNPVEKERFRP